MFFSDPTMHLCRSLDNYPMNVVFWFRDLNSMNYWILSVNQFLDDDLPFNFLYMKISFDCWLHRWLSYSSIFLCKCISSTFLTLANLFHPHSFTSRIKLKFIFVQRSDNQRDQTLASFSPQQFNLHCEYQWFFCLEHKRCNFFLFLSSYENNDDCSLNEFWADSSLAHSQVRTGSRLPPNAIHLLYWESELTKLSN